MPLTLRRARVIIMARDAVTVDLSGVESVIAASGTAAGVVLRQQPAEGERLFKEKLVGLRVCSTGASCWSGLRVL